MIGNVDARDKPRTALARWQQRQRKRKARAAGNLAAGPPDAVDRVCGVCLLAPAVYELDVRGPKGEALLLRLCKRCSRQRDWSDEPSYYTDDEPEA